MRTKSVASSQADAIASSFHSGNSLVEAIEVEVIQAAGNVQQKLPAEFL